jgi:hypothetical protein
MSDGVEVSAMWIAAGSPQACLAPSELGRPQLHVNFLILGVEREILSSAHVSRSSIP